MDNNREKEVHVHLLKIIIRLSYPPSHNCLLKFKIKMDFLDNILISNNMAHTKEKEECHGCRTGRKNMTQHINRTLLLNNKYL